MIDDYQDIINTLNTGDIDFDFTFKGIFEYQSRHNSVYRQFLDLIDSHEPIRGIGDIPFCPISVFKYHDVMSGSWRCQQYFLSSGTNGIRSRHNIRGLNLYHQVAQNIFESYFGRLSQYQIFALLPNYQDNPHSSLISMVDYFGRQSAYRTEYFLNDQINLYERIEENLMSKVPTILFAVSFALLDYVDQHEHELNDNFIIIETGGMKKYKKEMTKIEILQRLRTSFDRATICSEYGMTECLSQAYSFNSEWLLMNPYFKIIVTDPMDPKSVLPHGRIGRINIVDLANIDTLSFIATDDLGKISLDDPNKFQILGRLSNTDLRGCNYLI